MRPAPPVAPARPPVPGATPVRHAVAAAVGLTLLIQTAVAVGVRRPLETPNPSTEVARRLVAEGRYEAARGFRLWGPDAGPTSRVRAWVPPGEPLYLAAVIATVPPAAQRLAHVPVTAVLVGAVAATAGAIGGGALALAVGLVAALHPFIVAHGAVWDDTFLCAAALWTAVAIVAWRARRQVPGGEMGGGRRARVALALVGAVAGVTRAEGLVAAALLAVVACAPPLRLVRRELLAAAAGAIVAAAAWGIRNVDAVGGFVVGSTRDGIALWESNGPYTRAALRRGQVDAFSREPRVMNPYWARTAGLGEAAANRVFLVAALDWIVAHPAESARTTAHKLALTLLGVRPGMSLGAPRNAAAIAGNAVLLVLAAVGFSRRREILAAGPRELRPVVAAVLAAAVIVLAAGPVGWRYRMTLDGGLSIAAGAGLLAIVTRLRRRVETVRRARS